MSSDIKGQATLLLQRWKNGDDGALEELMPIMYDELHRIAGRHMAHERNTHTLQPTALMNEAYLRIVDLELTWNDRAHFVRMASRTMRRVLVDHARAKAREKRGGGVTLLELREELVSGGKENHDRLALDEALTELSKQSERASRAIELHYFGGLEYEEIAEALGVGKATVGRDMRTAKAWLRRRLRDTPPPQT